MKKSKIIIPALGMLLLSTAASVSGTVAWFTSVSSAQANVTSFAVRKLGGDLDYSVAAGTGTKKHDDTNKAAIELNGTNPALCDASYNHTTGSVWKANSNATAFTEIDTESLANWTAASDATSITYYAVSWTYTFTYQFGGDSTAVNLYFDSKVSTADRTQVSAAASGHSEQTYTGFRIAFICGSRAVVWAKNQAQANCSYITAANNGQSGSGTYANVNSDSAAGTLLDSTGLTALGENATGSTARADYLGQFTSAANGDSLTVKCIAWYEGTDPNVVNGAAMDSVTCVLNFYTRPNA